MTVPARNIEQSEVRGERTVVEKFRAQAALRAERPDLLHSRHRILLGDARHMPELTDEGSVQLVVTSPPYWTLKQYENESGDSQLGDHTDYESFHNELAKVWRRCFDLLSPGGRLCVVVGDVCLARKKNGRHLVMPLHADITVHCRRIGFDYLTPILWSKISNAATEVEGNGAGFLGKPYEPNAIVKNDVEYILLFRKPGGYRSPTPDQRVLSLIDKAEHARWFRSIWTDIPGASTRAGHPAPYPTELAYRLVRMFSFVGDTVLDPFLGTASTTEAAILANRSSIGYEIEPKYWELAKRRFVQHEPGVEIRFQ